jgi:Protein of unknown function (DUF2778)
VLGTRRVGGPACIEQPRWVGDWGALTYIGLRSTSAGIGALAFGFTLGLVVTYSLADAGRRSVPARLSDVETAFRNFRPPFRSQTPSGFQLASLETPFGSDFSVENLDSAAQGARGVFGNRFLSGERPDSFDERFGGDADSAETTTADEAARGRSVPKRATSSSIVNTAKKQIRTAALSQDVGSFPNADSRTAIYDIAARTVYLPNGRRLEAHSGLGSFMDDPRYINVKARGPTPPNVYNLTLREQLFHGVRAIRLNPIDDSKMFGRDGILAHTYMLGSKGQSNGCVSFSDYNAFLNAYLTGEIDRLVVVEHLATTPDSDTASGWIPGIIKDLFRRS